MNTKQIIDEMEKEFDETIGTEIGTQEWAYFTNQKKVIKSFIHSYTRKLIESVAEEIIPGKRGGMAESLSMEAYVNGFNDAVSYMSLKVKEIINSLEK